MNGSDDLVKDVEKDLLKEIVMNMNDNKISMNEAQHLAQDFLALLPVEDKKDLLIKLQRLGKEYPEAQAVYLKYAKTDEEQARIQKLDQMTAHIKTGNIDQAISIAKGGN